MRPHVPMFVLRALGAALVLPLALPLTDCAGDPAPFDQEADPVGEASQAQGAAITCITVQRGTFGAVEDASIAANVTTPGWNVDQLRAGNGYESLVQFDVSAIPPDACVTSATLTLWATGTVSGQRLDVYTAASPWSEGTVTYGTFSPQIGKVAGSLTPTVADAPVSASLQPKRVQAWVSGTSSNDGFILETSTVAPQPSDPQDSIFETSESPAVAHRPALQVCYTPHYCQNGGVCQNDGSGCTCVCPAGFSGQYCEIVDLCAGVSCPATAPCIAGGSCDPSTGQCVYTTSPDGTPCDDGDARTTGDSCHAGVCAGIATGSILAGGVDHSLAVRAGGAVWGWGANWIGQLGDGTTTMRTTAVATQASAGFVAVAAGTYKGGYSLALRSDGTVWGWGANYAGQLGDGTTVNRTSSVVQTLGIGNVVAIAAGYIQSLALRSDGTLWAWGDNTYGQLGIGTTTTHTTPVQVTALSSVVAVSGGFIHSLAARADGTVWAWGGNYGGQVGDGTTTTRTTPVQVAGLSNVTGVAGGWMHSLAVRADGTVWAWGDDSGGQLGNGTTTSSLVPVQVVGLGNVVTVAAGAHHSVALRSDGTVWAWGDSVSTVPVQVAGLSSVVAIAAGNDHSLAQRADGTVWAWGSNSSGQLGDGTTTNRAAPVQVLNLP